MNIEVRDLIKKSLPDWASAFLNESTESIGCDPSYNLTAFLALASTCIGNSARVEVKNGWTESAGIYAAIVGSPSSKKSPAIKTINLPLDEIQKDFDIDYNASMEALNLECIEGDTKPKRPKYQTVSTTDTTMEALAVALRDNYNGVMIRKDELNHLFKSLNAYKSGGGDLETLLELYNNGLITINRKGTERPIQVINPFLTIIGGLQEKPFKEIFSNESVGLKERFIYAFSNVKIEKRIYSRVDISKSTMERYVKNIQNIYSESYLLSKNHTVNIYKLSDEAKEFWISWQEQIPISPEIDAMYEKAIARAVRFSLILEIFKNPNRKSLTIDLASMKSAIQLTEFYIDAHKKAIEIFEDNDTHRKLRLVLEWLKKSYANPRMIKIVNGMEGISVRSVYNNNVAGVKNATEARTQLELLEEKGYGKFVKSSNSSNSPEIFSLSPKFR